MSLDTSKQFLSFQILDLGVTVVSGVLTDHSALSNLDYASSGHTGFAASAHVHADYLNKDGSVALTGPWYFGSQTISGTGDIHGGDFYGDGSNLTGIGGVGNPLEIGTDDTTKGALYLYGAATTSGGEIRVYNPADHASPTDYWTLRGANDEFQIGTPQFSKYDIIAFDYQGSGTYHCRIGTDVTLVVREGFVQVGNNNVKQGRIDIYGNASDTGASLYLYPGSNYDDVSELYGLIVSQDKLNLGPDDHTDAFVMDVDGHIYPGVSGTYNLGAVGLPYGSIYADDVYIKGSSLHIGDNVTLGEYNNTDLQTNSDIYLAKSGGTTFYMPAGSSPMIFKVGGSGGDGDWRFQDSNSANQFRIGGTGGVTAYNWISFSGPYGLTTFNDDINIRMNDIAGNYKVSFWDDSPAEVASINSNGDIASSGTIGWDTVQLSEYNNTDLAINSDIRLTKANPMFYSTSGSNDFIFRVNANQTFKWQNAALGTLMTLSNAGAVSHYGSVSFIGAEYGINSASNNDMSLRVGDSAGANKIYFESWLGTELVSIYSDGQSDFLGNVTVSGTGDFGGTITAGGTTPEIQFSATSGTIGVSGNVDLIQLTGADVTFDGDILFGANTISGTGDIYCADLYTSGSSLHVGTVNVQDDAGTLKIDANVEVSVPGVANTVLDIACTAGYWGQLRLVDGSNVKYEIGKSSSNDFFVYDTARSNNVIRTNAEELTLYYGGSPKLATSNTGVTVTGDLTTTGDVFPTVSGAGEVGTAQKPWNQLHLIDQVTDDVYSIAMVSGTLVQTLV